MKTFPITIQISEQIIEDTIVCALEGGSNYWYLLIDKLPEPNGEPLSIRISNAICNDPGYSLPVYDLETEEKLGELTQASMLAAFQLAATECPDALSSTLNETGDAGTADCLFQLAVMGEIIYG